MRYTVNDQGRINVSCNTTQPFFLGGGKGTDYDLSGRQGVKCQVFLPVHCILYLSIYVLTLKTRSQDASWTNNVEHVQIFLSAGFDFFFFFLPFFLPSSFSSSFFLPLFRLLPLLLLLILLLLALM